MAILTELENMENLATHTHTLTLTWIQALVGIDENEQADQQLKREPPGCSPEIHKHSSALERSEKQD